MDYLQKRWAYPFKLSTRTFFLLLLVGTISVSFSVQSAIGQPRKLPARIGNFSVKGEVRGIRPGQLTVQDKKGGRRDYMIQDVDEQALSIGDGLIMSLPAKIKVQGRLPGRLLEAGMVVEFKANANRAARAKGSVREFKVVNLPSSKWKYEPKEEPTGTNFVEVDIIGRVKYLKKQKKLLVEVPKTKFSRSGRITIELDDASHFSIQTDDLNRVRKGDKVTKMEGVKLDSGDWVVRNIEVEMDPDREAATFSFHDQLELKFSHLSDEPGNPRMLKSAHFILNTDISDRQAQVLLAKLENMYGLISKYYGRNCSPKKIVCYVVKDMKKWANAGFPKRGIVKILEGAGVTISLTNGRDADSVVYSCDNQGVVQHEAVHAFCTQTFGDAGPTWYAEGMAEMGQYWKPGQLAVDIDPVVIKYLTKAKPKPLAEIVKAGQITGDSWEAYSWRWALCHMLASNSNYSRNFKKLGVLMMRSQKGATFDAAYGKVAKEMQFEYSMFCKNFGNGYRADLCVWDWTKKPKILPGGDFAKYTVKAAGGWQATSLKVQAGKSYDVLTKGTWKIEKKGEEVTGDGYKGGSGKLLGVIYKDYKLSKPFELGAKTSFTASQDGQLYLRCNDDWLDLGDNEGELSVYFQNAKK